MLHRKLFVLPIALAVLAASLAADELKAIVCRDTELVIESVKAGSTPIRLEQGHGVWILPEMSNDRQLYVSSEAEPTAGVVGWIEREAVNWPDGTPVPGNGTELPEPPRSASQLASTNDAQQLPAKDAKPGHRSKKSRGRHGKHEGRGDKSAAASAVKEAPVQAIAAKSAPTPSAEAEAAESASAKPASEKSIPEMLLGLVTDAKIADYAKSVAHEKNLSREEKVTALKIFHKYLLERRERLAKSGTATESERAELQRQSEDLLANLGSLQEKAKPARKAKQPKAKKTEKTEKVAKATTTPKAPKTPKSEKIARAAKASKATKADKIAKAASKAKKAKDAASAKQAGAA